MAKTQAHILRELHPLQTLEKRMAQMKQAYNVILIARHPNGIGRSQVGKVVKRNRQIVYQFNKATIMRATESLGVHPSALDYCLKSGAERIEFQVAGRWLFTTPQEVLKHGFLHSFNSHRPPHFNLPLSYWREMEAPEYIHVPNKGGFIVELPWVEPEKVLGQMEMSL